MYNWNCILAISCIPYHKEGYTASGRPLWFLEATYSTPKNIAPFCTSWHGMLPALGRTQSRKVLCGRHSEPSCYLGFTIQQTLSGKGCLWWQKDALWRLWQASVGETQCKPLGFWHKAIPAAVKDVMPFIKQFLMCYWALIKTECLAWSNCVTAHYPLRARFSWTCQAIKWDRPISWKWYICNRA